MRILFFLTVLGGGGAEMNFVRLAAELRKQGIEPIYATCRGGGSYEKLLPHDVRHCVLDTGSINSGTVRLIRSIGPLRRLIDEVEPDIVCPVLTLTTLPAIVAASRARHKAKIVLAIQNALEPALFTNPGLYTRIQRKLTEKLWPKADGLIAISKGVAKDISTYLQDKAPPMDVVYNVGKPLAEELDRSGNASIDTPGDRIQLVACGRLTRQKDYPTLLKAMSLLQTSPRPILRILGTGSDLNSLKALVSELGLDGDVIFLGFRDDVLAHMRSADVFILSSRWEGFGNVIVEAMSVGTPVISTRCPHGPDEIITDGVSGRLVDVADAGELAAAIDQIVSNTDLSRRLAEAGLARAEDFSAAKIGAEYAASFRRFAEGKQPSRVMGAL